METAGLGGVFSTLPTPSRFPSRCPGSSLLFPAQFGQGMRTPTPPLRGANAVSCIVSRFHPTLFVSMNICSAFGRSPSRTHRSLCAERLREGGRGRGGRGIDRSAMVTQLEPLAGLFPRSGAAMAKHVLKWDLQEGFLSAWQNRRCVDCRGFCVVAFANLSRLGIVQKVYFTSRSSQKGSEYLCVCVCVFLSPALQRFQKPSEC